MKKRLEAELISIAHRILKLKNKSEIDQLHKETQRLYETLTILKFYQDNFESVKDEVSQVVLEEKLAKANKPEKPMEAIAEVKEEVTVPTVEVAAETEPVAEENMVLEVDDESFEDNDVIGQNTQEDHEEGILAEPESEDNGVEEPVPVFELEAEEEIAEEITPEEEKTETQPVSIENLLGEDYSVPVFVKPDEMSLFSTPKIDYDEYHKTSLNDSLTTGIAVGLNDRIGFVKNLFDDSSEDFNRVLSQMNTFGSYEEAKNFIEDMVKPDYNNWEGREDYEERFMEIVAKKFL